MNLSCNLYICIFTESELHMNLEKSMDVDTPLVIVKITRITYLVPVEYFETLEIQRLAVDQSLGYPLWDKFSDEILRSQSRI